jgi:hypothetical protein
VGEHSDFLVVSAGDRLPRLRSFFDASSESIELRGGVAAARWAVATFGAPTVTVAADVPRTDPRVIICGTPVSGRADVTATALAKRGSFGDLIGPFAVLRVHRDGSLDVTNDPFCMQALYWLDISGIQIVATRLDLVIDAYTALTRRSMTIDVDAALSVAVRGLAIGEETAFQEVRIIEFGFGVESTERGALRKRRSWALPWDVALRSPREIDDEISDEIERQVIGLRNTVDGSEYPVEVDLTGGKDSRLVLAICARAGLLDRVLFVTRGSIDQPDVVIATHVAAELGLNHAWAQWEGPRQAWDRELLERAWCAAGRGSVFDDSLIRIGRSWRVIGVLGETWRTNYPNQLPDDSFDLIVKKELWYLDRRSAYIRDAPFQRAVERSTAQLCDIATTARISDVRDAQYILDRVRTWLGSRVRSFDRTNFALYSPRIAALAFAVGLDARLDERLRLAAMRLCPIESQLPFTKALTSDQPLPELPPTPDQARRARGEKVIRPDPILSYQDWTAVRRQNLGESGEQTVERWTAIRSALLDDGPDHPVFDLVDYQTVAHDLDAGPSLDRNHQMWICDLVAAKYQLDG